MKKILFIVIIFYNFIFSSDWCGTAHQNVRDFERFEYTFPQFIDSTHYRVHFTVEPADSFYWNNSWMTHQSTIDYATTLLEQAEFSYLMYEEAGWQMPPPDCDESIVDINNPYHCNNYGGNSLYDIYIGLVQGAAALVASENPNNQLPYVGSFSSYMLFGNGLGLFGSFDDLASINYYIVAHEVHHSIQFAYGPNFTGTPQDPIHQLWMFEQTATFMENFIYPDAFHLRILLSNCNITTPLTYPEIGVYQSYSGALWQVFLNDYFSNPNLVRYFWESYGTRINNGETHVTFFDIFNDEILAVSNNTLNLEDMYKEYSIWRYFTGERSISGQYFNQSNLYCTSTAISIPENNLQLQTELGGNYYIEIPNQDIKISLESNYTDLIPMVLIKIPNNDSPLFIDFSLNMGDNIISIDNQFDGNHILVPISGYTDNDLDFENILISIDIQGDINNDEMVDILDIVLLVDMILNNIDDISGDINNDGTLNVIDIVQLVNIIIY